MHFNFDVFILCTVLDDEDEQGVITTGAIVTVSVTVKRKNLAVSVYLFYIHNSTCRQLRSWKNKT